MITVEFFDDKQPIVEYQSTKEEVHKNCEHGFGGCVLILPNFRGDRCYTVVPLSPPEEQAKWRKATVADCKRGSPK